MCLRVWRIAFIFFALPFDTDNILVKCMKLMPIALIASAKLKEIKLNGI